jgi:hypothetical protein
MLFRPDPPIQSQAGTLICLTHGTPLPHSITICEVNKSAFTSLHLQYPALQILSLVLVPGRL